MAVSNAVSWDSVMHCRRSLKKVVELMKILVPCARLIGSYNLSVSLIR